MRRMHGFAWRFVLLLTTVGCESQSAKSPDEPAPAGGPKSIAAAATDPNGPAAAVSEFLEAVRTGNDQKATLLLSAAAREKTAVLNHSVTPPASDTARFTVGKVEYLGDDGARVACTWTDFDSEGKPKTDDAIWVLRREAGGWRVAGVAAIVFPGEPPLLLNFEDPQDLFRKQRWIREEIRRRTEKARGDLQAQGPENREKSVRR